MWTKVHNAAMTSQELIELIERHSRETSLSPSTICERATGNSRLYDRLKRRVEQVDRDAKRIADFIASQRVAEV